MDNASENYKQLFCHMISLLFVICQIGITDPEDQQKLLSAVQQLHTDKVDLDTFSQVEVTDSG